MVDVTSMLQEHDSAPQRGDGVTEAETNGIEADATEVRDQTLVAAGDGKW